MACWPPEETQSGTVHWLAQSLPNGAIAIERAVWHPSTEDSSASWDRWIDSRPVGDFADLCRAIYIGPAESDPAKATIIVPCCNIMRAST